jgi:hypothetical protein
LANPPATCSVAFKEWAGVCDALADGRQSIILRKGGIREEPGPGAFVPEHDAFWLYPTAVHQAQQGLRSGATPRSTIATTPGSTIPIGLLARVELIGRIRDEARLPALEDFHVLTAETVRSRFHYRTPGLDESRPSRSSRPPSTPAARPGSSSTSPCRPRASRRRSTTPSGPRDWPG